MVFAIMVFALGAHADTPCTAIVHDWVGRAATAGHMRMIARACSPTRVRVRLEPDGAEPYEVEVAEGPGEAFRQVGRFRLSPLLEVDDWSALPAPRREAFEALASWIGAHAGEVHFVAGSVPAPARALLRPFGVKTRYSWLLALALGLVLATRLRSPPRIDRGDRIVFGALFATALALRVAFGFWGPHHPGAAPMWIVGGTSNATELMHYGPGYPELFMLLTAPLRAAHIAPDHALYFANAVLSALVAALAFAVARLAGVDLRRACLPAVLIAVEPVSVRIGASESYFVPIAALCLAAIACLLAAVDQWFATPASRPNRSRGLAFAIAGGLLVAQAMRIHPIAWGEAAFAPLFAFASPRPERMRERVVALVSAYLVVGVVVLVTSGAQLLGVVDSLASGELARTRPVATIAPVILVLLVCMALTFVARPRWLPLLAAPHLAIAAATRVQYTMEGALWMESYDTLVFVVPAIALASIIPERLAKVRFVPLASTLASAVLLVAWRLPAVRTARSTNHLEHAWIRAWMTQLPPQCRTVHIAFAGYQDLFLPTYAAAPRPPSMFVRLDLRRDVDLETALGEVRCTYYFHTSLCSTEQGRDACARIEAQLALVPAARNSFPAVPRDRFVISPVESVIYRVTSLR
jgi:hypothetical protein